MLQNSEKAPYQAENIVRENQHREPNRLTH